MYIFEIQKGRMLGIERKERMCHKCQMNELGDEFHYVFCCPFFENDRRLYLKSYYYKYPNVLKYNKLFCSEKKNQLSKLAKFMKTITKNVY